VISSLILEKLKRDAEAKLGEFRKVVITVPARRSVEQGLTGPPENSVRDTTQGWLPSSLDVVFGLGHADSVRKRTRRVNRALPDSSGLRQDIAAIRPELRNSSPKKIFGKP
jgi:hypothetical protein